MSRPRRERLTSWRSEPRGPPRCCRRRRPSWLGAGAGRECRGGRARRRCSHGGRVGESRGRALPGARACVIILSVARRLGVGGRRVRPRRRGPARQPSPESSSGGAEPRTTVRGVGPGGTRRDRGDGWERPSTRASIERRWSSEAGDLYEWAAPVTAARRSTPPPGRETPRARSGPEELQDSPESCNRRPTGRRLFFWSRGCERRGGAAPSKGGRSPMRGSAGTLALPMGGEGGHAGGLKSEHRHSRAAPARLGTEQAR